MISVLMPSARQELCLKRILDFEKLRKEAQYELVICSPFKVESPNVVWIPDEKMQGTGWAFMNCYFKSRWDLILFTSDYASPREGTFSGIVDLLYGKKLTLGAYRIFRGAEQRQWGCYGKMYAMWGCGRRRDIDQVGGFNHWPTFKSFWQDVDLSMRFYANGGNVELCPEGGFDLENAKDAAHSKNWERYFEEDKGNFITRWHHIFGAEYSTNWQEFNKEI